MAQIKLEGLMPAMLVPFKENGALDIDGIKKNAEFLKKAGCSGIVCNGSTGEAANLVGDERSAVIKATKEVVGNDLLIVAGTGAPTTNVTLALTEEAVKAGADVALVITPFNVIPNPEGLYRHYAAVADLGVPMILYNLPEHTGVEIGFETVERLLAKYNNVVGMKESSGDLAYFAELMRRFFSDRFVPFTGADALFMQTTFMGSPAAILALGNIAPEMIIEVMNLAKQGKIEKAKEIYYKLVPIARAISDSVNFPAPVKEAVRLLGRPAGDPRLPTLPVDKEESEAIRKALQIAGLL